MNTFQTVVRSNYGDEVVTGDKAQIINRARKRKYDGQPDRRTTYGKLAWFIIKASMERTRAKYLAGSH